MGCILRSDASRRQNLSRLLSGVAKLLREVVIEAIISRQREKDERLRNFRAATCYSERFSCRCVLMFGLGRVIPL